MKGKHPKGLAGLFRKQLLLHCIKLQLTANAVPHCI